MNKAKRLLGVDHGTVRIGLAVSDPDGKIAFPLTTYERQNPEQDAAFFRKIVADHRIDGIVVGLPLHLDGKEGTKATEARRFAAWLGECTRVPVVCFDERCTTVHAEKLLWEAGLTHKRRKAKRDRVAAQIMLQAYLEAVCPADGSEDQAPDSPWCDRS